MRPNSIVRFEKLFLLSLVLALIDGFVQFGSTVRQIEADPGLARLGAAPVYAAVTLALGLAIPLVLWFLIARRASNVAKWILVLITLVGLWFLIGAAGQMAAVPLIVAAALTALQIAAIAFLFQPDAKAWLTASGPEEDAVE